MEKTLVELVNQWLQEIDDTEEYEEVVEETTSTVIRLDLLV